MMIGELTSEQVRAARAMLRWEQKLLAKQSRVSIATIKRIEAGIGLVTSNWPTVQALYRAFIDSGVTFDDVGVSFRLKRVGDRVIDRDGKIGIVVDTDEDRGNEGDGYPMILVRYSDQETLWSPQFSVLFGPAAGVDVDNG